MGAKKDDKKDSGEKKSADAGGAKKADSESSTIVLKLDLHCEGCAKKVKSSIRRLEGTLYTDTPTTLGWRDNVDAVIINDVLSKEKCKYKINYLINWTCIKTITKTTNNYKKLLVTLTKPIRHYIASSLNMDTFVL